MKNSHPLLESGICKATLPFLTNPSVSWEPGRSGFKSWLCQHSKCASGMGPIVLLYLSVPDCRVGCRAALCGSRRSPKQAWQTGVGFNLALTAAFSLNLANEIPVIGPFVFRIRKCDKMLWWFRYKKIFQLQLNRGLEFPPRLPSTRYVGYLAILRYSQVTAASVVCVCGLRGTVSRKPRRYNMRQGGGRDNLCFSILHPKCPWVYYVGELDTVLLISHSAACLFHV